MYVNPIWAGLKQELIGNPVSGQLLAGVDNAPDRVYPIVIPQKIPNGPAQTPCTVFQQTGKQRDQTYCGTSSLVQARVSLDHYATSFEKAGELAAAVTAVLLDFSGMLGGVVDVRMATLENEIELMDPEPGLYRVSQTWSIWHVE